ncbi:C39 family peptidase [Bacillaceae bacterium SIJ1]|nr:C39 family peptidase [Litoribacterium kuwaitense]
MQWLFVVLCLLLLLIGFLKLLRTRKTTIFITFILFSGLMCLGFTVKNDAFSMQWLAQASPGGPSTMGVSQSSHVPKQLPRPDEQRINVPGIKQHPELPRGCEVTALAMLLQHAGVETDKMTLAEEIAKDPTPYEKTGDKVTFGNPHIGFVGDMEDLRQPGFGVYHGPIQDLAESYLPNQTVNLTGLPFASILETVGQGQPVWVITTIHFAPVPQSDFTTWQTDAGPITTTYREHSAVITGYNDTHVFINDPTDGSTNKEIPMEQFKQAWEQMGSQAITIQQSSPS